LAIFHSRIQVISRGKGKSAVAAAACRAGEKITNERDGITHDFTRKSGVVHAEILLPGHAPAEYSGRAILWNAVEKIEKAENSQLARELDIALPAELTREQNILLRSGE
jgi:ATP-dependent exoDNAse (exonuclease V) alpha subunit